MKTSLPLLVVLLLWAYHINGQNCTIQIPQDTFVCTYAFTLNAQPPGGNWSNSCELSPGPVDFFTINDSLTSVTVADCGNYYLIYDFAEIDSLLTFDTISSDPIMIDTIWEIDTLCFTQDTMELGFSNPGFSSFEILVNVSAQYPQTSCLPNDTVNCQNSFSLQNAEPPEMEWAFEVYGLCNTTLLNTSIVGEEGCEAEQILFESTSFSGTLIDTSVVYSNRFAEINPITGELIATPFQDAVSEVVNQAIANHADQCPLPVFCNTSPPWCIDTLRDTSVLIFPIRIGGDWTLFPETDSMVVLEDTTLLTIDDSTYLIMADPSANHFDARFDLFQINYEGDTIPSYGFGVLSLNWEEHWGMDTIIQITPRLVDTCCGGGLVINTNVLGPTPPILDCDPFQVIFLDELKAETTILECNETFYNIQIKIKGGNPPYQVEGMLGTLLDSIYTVENIPINIGFSILISDQDNCSTSVQGNACPCVGVAASALEDVILRCDDHCVPLLGQGVSWLSDSIRLQWELDAAIIVGMGDSIEVCDTGSYHLIATEFFSGCVDTAFIQVRQNIPRVDLGDSLILNCNFPALALGDSTLIDSDYLQYNWSGPGIDSSNQQASFPEITVGGTYTVIVLDTTNACYDTSMVSIEADFSYPIADAGPDHNLSCSPESFVLGSLNSTRGDSISFQWEGPSLILADTILRPSSSMAGTYILNVENTLNGCVSRDTTIIHPFDSIQFSTRTIASCWNDNSGVVVFEQVSGGEMPYAYSLGGISYRPTGFINDVPPGVWEAFVRDRRGCESSFILEVETIAPLEVPPVLPNEIHVCGEVDIMLDLSREIPLGDTLTYEWSDGTTLPYNQMTEAGQYGVTVTSTCETHISQFTVIDDSDIADRFKVPNIFTPNNDGVNDIFRPFTSLEIDNYELLVYNRWGQVVFETQTLENGWDGSVNQSLGVSDVYIWTIKGNLTICDGGDDQLFLKGDLTLIR